MTILLSFVFFLSGTSALLFEILWFRLSGLVFGNSVWAASIVLSSFMGGLALGNYLMAARGVRVKSPVRLYAFLELIIGCCGIFLIFLFPHLTKVLTPFFTPFLDQPAVLNFIRTFFAAALMLIPTTAMGATLPILVKAINRTVSNFGCVLGFLYGCNTLGAVLGVLLAEIFLIKRFGLTGTGFIAMSLNFLAALIAWVISRKLHEPLNPDKEPQPAVVLSFKSKKLVAVAFSCGFIFLALEVIWFRFLSLFFNAFSVNFAVMLAVVLLAISLGGFLASLLFKAKVDAGSLLTGLLYASALLIILTYAQFYDVLQLTQSYAQYSEILKIILCTLFLILPLALCSGMAFTVLGKLLYEEIRVEIRTSGLLTLANTLGSALGSFVAGFLLIPFLGVEKSFFLLALLYGVLIFLVIDIERALSSPVTKLRFYGLLILFGLTIAFFPSGAMLKYLDIPTAKFKTQDGENLVAVKEGMSETVQYLQKDLLERPHYLRLMTNGHSMSSTAISGKRYMKMFVYLPVALHPHPKKAALICFGCGMTAKALTDTRKIEEIEIVDISKDIIELSSVIFPDPASNPIYDKRVNIRIEDGRFFLQTTNKQFDIITGEPPPPKYRGIVNLYTQEHFELIRARLAPGGMVTYWLPVYMLTAENSKSILKAFCNVFPSCSLWSASGLNWMMVGIKDPGLPVSEDLFAAQWQDPIVRDELKALGFVSPEQLGSYFLADAKRIREWIQDTLPLTDNFPGRLDDGFREAAIIGERPLYKQLLDAKDIELNFAHSRDMAQIWPANFIARTLPYFPWAQGMTLDSPQTSLEFIQLLNRYLNSSFSTDFDIYWLLDSDEFAQRIVTDMLQKNGQTAETMINTLQALLVSEIEQNDHKKIPELMEVARHLAVRAVVARDFLLAEQYYEFLGPLSGPAHRKDFDYLRLYLLARSRQLQRAAEVTQQIRLNASVADSNDLDLFARWLASVPQ